MSAPAGFKLLGWPLDQVRITSPFGYRRDPLPGAHRDQMHPGIDLSCVIGTPVYAMAAGKVDRSYLSLDDPKGRWRGYGHRIVIDHGGGWTSSYAHLNNRLVVEGELVQAGQVIAASGNSGASTGPHLHFELRWMGEPLNPAEYLPPPKGTK